jgi:hypothetical protein
MIAVQISMTWASITLMSLAIEVKSNQFDFSLFRECIVMVRTSVMPATEIAECALLRNYLPQNAVHVESEPKFINRNVLSNRIGEMLYGNFNQNHSSITTLGQEI